MANSGPKDESEMDTTEIPASNSVTSEVFRSNLERHRRYVEGRMDPNHGLVDRLRETSAINYNEVETIRAIGVSSDKNRTILDFVLEGNSSEKIDKLRDALRKTKQRHLVNYVEANGVYKQEFENNWPLPENYIKIIDTNLSFLTERIDTASGLLAHLRKHDTITQRQEEYVRSYRASCDRNTALLDILQRGSLAEYKETIEAFEETSQKHLAEILRGSGLSNLKEEQQSQVHVATAMALDPQELEIRKGHEGDEEKMSTVRNMLIERMDPDFGLLDKLLQLGALTYPETERIKCDKSVFDRNAKLLELIFSKMQHQNLLTALTETGQRHLFNYVKGNGEYRPDYGTIWPLRERNTNILDVNRYVLVDIIDPRDLVARMFDKNVINNRQQSYINSLSNKTGKNEVLLDILRRGSENSYWKTVLCYRETDQSDVAEILVDGGVLATVHVSNEGEPEQVNEEEDRFLDILENLFQNKSIPEYHRIRQRLDLRIMRAKKVESILLYVYCKTLKELVYLHKLLTKGEFKKRIATVFDLLILKRVTLVSAVNWSDEEFARMKTYFEGKAQHDEEAIEIQQQSSDETLKVEINKETLNNIAIPEIGRMLVERIDPDFGLLDRLSAYKALSGAEIEEVKKLSTHLDKNSRLLELLTKNGKLKELFIALTDTRQQHLVNYVTAKGETKKFVSDWPLRKREIVILDDNQEYLTDNIDPLGLPSLLAAKNVITRRQMNFIESKPTPHEKTGELLNILRRCSLKAYYTAIDCLLISNQGHIAAVLKGRGVQARANLDLDQLDEEEYCEIVRKVTDLLEQISEVSTNRELKELQIRLEAAKMGSIEFGEIQRFKEVEAEAEKTVEALEVMAAILRNNTDYFLEYMRPLGLINRLLAKKCLTDGEARHLKTLSENDGLLKIIRGIGLHGYNVLIDFLRSGNQSLVAEVAEKGGVVVKATITTDLERVEKELVERIDLLLNKTSSRSIQHVQFLSLLGRGNIQILNARWEHDIIVWFWCRSEGALTAIDSMNETDEEELTQLMTELFKVLLDGKEHVPDIINIDLEDPDKMMVVRTASICADEDRELSLPKCSVCSAAILGSNIYILLQNPSCLLVFDKSEPSKPTNEIPLAVVADPVDMVSSQQSSCLYITDRGNSTVWKFTPTNKNVISWLKNVGSPYILSAKRYGGVIRVDRDQPFHLSVYSADAQRISHITLPDFVKMPHHAVETSAGTYIISYGESGGRNGVCEITSNGHIISVFDTLLESVEGIDSNVNKILQRRKFAEKVVCCPHYLAVNEHGEVYATDPVNGGLMVFDSRLKLEAIVKNDLLRKPVSVHCLKSMRQLLIVYEGEEEQTAGIFTHKLT